MATRFQDWLRKPRQGRQRAWRQTIEDGARAANAPASSCPRRACQTPTLLAMTTDRAAALTTRSPIVSLNAVGEVMHDSQIGVQPNEMHFSCGSVRRSRASQGGT